MRLFPPPGGNSGMMKYSILTDKGIVRDSNQDSCMAVCPDEDSCFAVVCDGMGGANAGDVASDIAVKTITERVTAGWRSGMSNESVINLLASAITAANIAVYDRAEEDPSLAGMGTTVVAAVVIRDRLVVAHAGDSRAYSLTDRLTCLTKDHSLVQSMVDEGLITEEQARVHPKKNYITRALGIEEKIEIDFSEFSFSPGEKVLLCSDGLTNFVTDEDICGILSEGPYETYARRLVNAANGNGGGDNISAVVILQERGG